MVLPPLARILQKTDTPLRKKCRMMEVMWSTRRYVLCGLLIVVGEFGKGKDPGDRESSDVEIRHH